jgi:pentatricopeptide repeat domain-containing protein 1
MGQNDFVHFAASTILLVLAACSVLNICHSYVIPGASSFLYSQVVENPLIRSRKSAYELRLERNSDGDKRSPVAASAEENLRLGVSIASLGFLKNIEEYGTARMARRAVGILSKMPAYREIPKQEHYTAAIWACENSDQFKLAMSVFQEMKAAGVDRVTRTYEGLISAAEKTKNWQSAIDIFDEMVAEGITGSTEACNSCMWAAEQGGRYDISLNLLTTMERENIPRNLATYAACAYSCEKAGEGLMALHVMDLMNNEGYELDTPVYKAAIWACVKVRQCSQFLLHNGLRNIFY